MPRFWLDANVFIEAHRKYYPVNRARSFWAWVAKKVEEGTIVCPRRVYQEIVENEDHQDELAQWVKVRKEKGLCIPPTRQIQERVGAIQVTVFSKYSFAEAWDFSKGGDPWVIAHALEEGGIVVTKESSLHPNSQKARIPDVCRELGVKCIDTVKMLELLDAEF